MSRRWLILALCVLVSTAVAQSTGRASVRVDSAFMRALPSDTSEPAGSAFNGEVLTVIGRSADGTWLNVHRPTSPEVTAWIRRDLVQFGGDVTALPLTDAVTGVTGDVPIMDTGFAVLMTGEAQLRTAPDRDAASLGVVPIDAVLPVVSRTPNAFWIKVNYLGTEGWIAEFTTSRYARLYEIPEDGALAGDPTYAALEIVDPARQIAQIDRLLEYLVPNYTLTLNVAGYWRTMLAGETKECLPPANVPSYPVSPSDLIELPELRRQTRLLSDAVASINGSLEIMRQCGVYLPTDARRGYQRAIAASATFNLLIRRMRVLRSQLTGEPLDDEF